VRDVQRTKENKKIPRFHRTYEIVPDTGRCLLEQGIVCMGIATMEGCGALCPKVICRARMFGPPEGVVDQGSKMLAALGSVLDLGEYKGMSERQVADKADAIVATIPIWPGRSTSSALAVAP